MALQEPKQKGQVLVLVALFIVVLMGVAALALDVGRAYGVKAKLNAAVDVAAVAAGRYVSQAQGLTDNVEKQASDVFKANYPDGLLGSTVTDPTCTAQHNTDGSWTITVSATASLPTNFAVVLPSGMQFFNVKASATSTVRTLDLVLVLDTSTSLKDPPPLPEDTTTNLLKTAAINFISKFDSKSDRVGLILFASGAETVVPITATKGFDPDKIATTINAISVSGATASEEAMRMAKAQLDAIPLASQNSLRVIVLFTDGAPNTIAGYFRGSSNARNLYSEYGNIDDGTRAVMMYVTNKRDNPLADDSGIATLPTTDYTGTVNLQSDLVPVTRTLTTAGTSITNNKCNVNRAARNMLENVANAARSESASKPGEGEPIRIFTIGLGDNLVTTPEIPPPNCGYGNTETGQNILRRLANLPGVDTYNKLQHTGMYTWAQNSNQLNTAFQQVANQILRLAN